MLYFQGQRTPSAFSKGFFLKQCIMTSLDDRFFRLYSVKVPTKTVVN